MLIDFRWLRSHMVNRGNQEVGRRGLHGPEAIGSHQQPLGDDTRGQIFWEQQVLGIWRGRQDSVHLLIGSKCARTQRCFR